MRFKKFPDIERQVQELSSSEQEAIWNLFRRLSPTYALQRKFMEYLLDLRARDERKIDTILEDIRDIIEDSTLRREEKWKRVGCFLREKRFPLLTKAEGLFQKKIENLDLPEGCRLVPPECWEGNDYKLELHFTNAKESLAKLQRLFHLAQTPTWQELFDEDWFEELFS